MLWTKCVVCGSGLMLKIDQFDPAGRTEGECGYAFGGYQQNVVVSAEEILGKKDRVTDCWCPQCKLKYHVED